MQTKIIERLQQIPTLRAVYSKHLLLALAIYPVAIAIVSTFLLKAFAPVTDSTQDVSFLGIFILFLTIASTFSLIPSGIMLIFTLPTYLTTKDAHKFIYSGGLVKTSIIASTISVITLLTSLYLF